MSIHVNGILTPPARRKNKALIGRELDILVEGPSEKHELVMAGRHAGQAPEVDGKVYLGGGEVARGQIRRVRITQAADYDLVGDVIDEAPDSSRPHEYVGPRPKRRVVLPVINGLGG